jgi:DNA-binding transcriptional ArsR family regulator
MSLEISVNRLKAVAEPTRVRLLLLLARGEATVGELQVILDQSQPRVSRHLRLLADADLVERFRDGQSVYYGLARTPFAQEIAGLLAESSGADAQLTADARALDELLHVRRRAAFNQPALLAAAQTGARPALQDLQTTIEELLGGFDFSEALDVGCGGGGLLPWLGGRAANVVGVDTARSMRLIARARIQAEGVRNCTVRAADLSALPFADDSFDLVILDEVLGPVPDMSAGLREARRVLRRTGRLVILDRVEPAARQLAPGCVGVAENQLDTLLAAAGLKVIDRGWLPGRVPDYAAFAVVPAPSAVGTGTDG